MPTSELVPQLRELPADRAPDVPYRDRSRARSTVLATERDWERFCRWSVAQGVDPTLASPLTVEAYLTEHATSHSVATLERWLASLTVAFRTAGREPPSRTARVQDCFRGIRRAHGRPQRQAAPLTLDLLRQCVARARGAFAVRDRAMLLLGWAGALRRSELVAIRWDDLAVDPQGLRVTIGRSKTDQEGAGFVVGIPYGIDPWCCPVKALEEWRSTVPASSVLLFPLVAEQVTIAVKRCVRRLGIDTSIFSAHSLRSGLATSAAQAGVPEREIAETTGHRSMAVLRRYIRAGGLFLRCAPRLAGL